MENKVIQKFKNIGSSFVCFSVCTKSQTNCDIENATKSTSTFKEHRTVKNTKILYIKMKEMEN